MGIITKSIISAAIMGTACVASATPTFSNINNSSGEVSQAGLFHAVYGGTWTVQADGRSLSNGSLTATRVADGGVGMPLDVQTSTATGADDQAWSSDSPVMIVAKTRFAADSHNFGWIDDTMALLGGGPAFQVITSTSTLNTPVTVSLSSSFRWAFKDLSTNQLLTSRNSDNPSGAADQMATYRITGSSVTGTKWLLVWEDRTSNSDRDFNDSAIEVSSVPTPGALALCGIAALTLGRRRR
jgi:MYXO-CTERM domain-containing protein